MDLCSYGYYSPMIDDLFSLRKIKLNRLYSSCQSSSGALSFSGYHSRIRMFMQGTHLP